MPDPRRTRLTLLAVVVGLIASVVGLRLFDLQVRQRDRFREMALGQHQRRFEVAATRGTILDRNGDELALSVATQSLYAHPTRVQDPDRVAGLLAPLLGVRERELREKLTSSNTFVWLHRFLEPEQVAAVRDLGLLGEDPSPFGLLESSKRVYPQGKLGVHVVGFASIDGPRRRGHRTRIRRVPLRRPQRLPAASGRAAGRPAPHGRRARAPGARSGVDPRPCRAAHSRTRVGAGDGRDPRGSRLGRSPLIRRRARSWPWPTAPPPTRTGTATQRPPHGPTAPWFSSMSRGQRSRW